ncbi:hypothetical protein HNP82_000280 [Catenibacillus scindens]|uniref:DRTGG domain-containing protein n=1 Tax=Catenibacillus scindens TaxID=673271 RepID=A0A7W8M4D2_9FIRM|nr:hypothetical protein [Catenibacillus scindens]MBB5263186.1 hypothetical protein [Catenibacillus scindens]
MTLQTLVDKEIFTSLYLPEHTDTEITVPFCCDLLSIAMSRAPAGCAWVTVMANMNTLAVAALTDCACVILAEGTSFDEACLNKAREQGIPVFSTTLPIFEAALKVWEEISQP